MKTVLGPGGPSRRQAILLPGIPLGETNQMPERMTLYHDDGSPVQPPICRGPFVITPGIPNLNTGIELYLPKAGDLIINILLDVVEAFSESEDEVDPQIGVGQYQTEQHIFGSYMDDAKRTDGVGWILNPDDPLTIFAAYGGSPGDPPLEGTQGKAFLYIITVRSTPFVF